MKKVHYELRVSQQTIVDCYIDGEDCQEVRKKAYRVIRSHVLHVVLIGVGQFAFGSLSEE